MSETSVNELHPLTMPKWGMAMQEGKIVSWLKEPGSVVKSGDEVFEVETEKIVNVVESTVDGMLLRQTAEVDEVYPVGSLVGVVGPKGTPSERVDEFAARFQDRFREFQQQEEQAVPVERVTLAVADRKICYLSLGDAGVPVLLIHGMGSDLSSWLFNHSVLAEEREVIAVDLAGHGGSSKNVQTGDVAELTQEVVCLLDALNIERVHLVGHSLGGSVAAQLTLQQPQRVASLSLISSLGPGTQVSETFLDTFVGAVRRKELKASMVQLVANPEMITRELVENILRVKRIEGVQQSWEKIVRCGILDPMMNQNTSILVQIEVPVQLIFGAEDQIVPVPVVEDLPDGVSLQLLENAGHIPHMESASKVNTLLSNFLTEHDD